MARDPVPPSRRKLYLGSVASVLRLKFPHILNYNSAEADSVFMSGLVFTCGVS
jgi:hypothetical protein